jgi:hypothetical protein
MGNCRSCKENPTQFRESIDKKFTKLSKKHHALVYMYSDGVKKITTFQENYEDLRIIDITFMSWAFKKGLMDWIESKYDPRSVHRLYYGMASLSLENALDTMYHVAYEMCVREYPNLHFNSTNKHSVSIDELMAYLNKFAEEFDMDLNKHEHCELYIRNWINNLKK